MALEEPAMSEIIRSGLILCMGLTVMCAGIVVILYS